MKRTIFTLIISVLLISLSFTQNILIKTNEGWKPLDKTTIDVDNNKISVPQPVTRGIILPSASTHIWASGGSVIADTLGTNVACSVGDRYWVELMIPYNVTLTGLSYLVGTVGGTDSVVVQLCNSAGTEVATSRAAGTPAVIVGTAKQFQSVPFTATYSAKAGLYYAVVQFNGTTAKFRTYSVPGSKFIGGTAVGVWQTKANITPGTTFTVDKAPIIITY